MDKTEKKAITQAVYDIVKIIPRGRATSYGAIAKAIGYGNMSRMVGKIMSECNSSENNIPAHRVVNSQGFLSGKDAFGDSDEMRKLLESEGIIVINDKIKNWKNVFWNPAEEILL
ncbi:MGMT family protein [Bacteroidales bacterium OttesenSCG-928-I21]|nr:MGMT family protein [Bacteroidales bacterium OttesenSCG-928-I21]